MVRASQNFTIDNNEVVLESRFHAFGGSTNHRNDFNIDLYPLGGLRESEVIKQAIALAQIENCDPDYMAQVLVNLMICIKNGNCELPIRNFK